MSHIETLVEYLPESRNCINRRDKSKYSYYADILSSVNYHILKAELADKSTLYLNEIESFLSDYIAPFGKGLAISSDAPLMSLVAQMAVKTADSLSCIQKIREEREALYDFPEDLYTIFSEGTNDDKKKSLREFIERNRCKQVADVAKDLHKLRTKNKVDIPGRKHKHTRELLGKYLPDIVSDDADKDHSLNNTWNKNL